MNIKWLSILSGQRIRRKERRPHTGNYNFIDNFYIVNSAKGTALEVRAIGDWFEAGKHLSRNKDWLYYDASYLFDLLNACLRKPSIALAYTKAILDFISSSRNEDDIHILSYLEYRRSEHAWTLLGHAAGGFYARHKARRWNNSKRKPIRH